MASFIYSTMNQKQASTIIIGLAIALAMLTGVIVTVATISQQAHAQSSTALCMQHYRPIYGGPTAARICVGAGPD
jgi:hypothetical protein